MHLSAATIGFHHTAKYLNSQMALEEFDLLEVEVERVMFPLY